MITSRTVTVHLVTRYLRFHRNANAILNTLLQGRCTFAVNIIPELDGVRGFVRGWGQLINRGALNPMAQRLFALRYVLK